MKLDVKVDIQRARRELAGLEREVNKAAGRALDRVATTVRKEADQEIRKRLTLKSSVVKNSLEKVRPYGRALIRDIVASGRPIPLRDYRARQTRKGVTFAVTKGAGRSLYVRKGKHAFIGKGRLPDRVFVARGPNPPGPKHAPIKQVFGPSIPQYFVTKTVKQRMTNAGAARWPIEFGREMKYRRQKLGLVDPT